MGLMLIGLIAAFAMRPDNRFEPVPDMMPSLA
jgi:hypothetical protein